MRPGGGKNKDSSFERKICKDLHLWTLDGKDDGKGPIYWRTPGSGAKATRDKSQNILNERMSGDIMYLRDEGKAFLNTFYIEIKSYKSIGIGSLVWWQKVRKGQNAYQWWYRAIQEAMDINRRPMLIMKENTKPTLLAIDTNIYRKIGSPNNTQFKCDELGMVIFEYTYFFSIFTQKDFRKVFGA